MKKKTVKLINICVIMLFTILAFSNIAFATITPGTITGTAPTQGANTAIQNVGNDIVGVLTTVGVVLSVVILIVIGIKYMMGSAEEKAEYKKTMMPYIVGAALIFAASALATVVYNFMKGISTT